MYATVYGIFMWLTAELEDKYEEKMNPKGEPIYSEILMLTNVIFLSGADAESVPLTTLHRDSHESLVDYDATSSADVASSFSRIQHDDSNK
jgi:hypothetical protein